MIYLGCQLNRGFSRVMTGEDNKVKMKITDATGYESSWVRAIMLVRLLGE